MNNIFLLSPRRSAAILISLVLLALLLPAPAQAHRVNIFVWLEGDSVMVKCGFNRNSPVKNGLIAVFDVTNGKKLLQGHTDGNGCFSFPIPPAARAGHSLRIQIAAGEGHQNEWIMDASEFSGAAAPTANPMEKVERAGRPQGAADSATAATPDEVRAIVNAALDTKLGPIRRDLAAQVNAGPSLRDTIGGIGWILGLVGIGLYLKGRRG
ncbi:cobalamin biosynthesis protein CbiL [uncultured Desulfovibrio sp.]|uniref:cobalamin biosynthesis protein CbiL n=1 Tax=uncultured Desulfovibrio sp. TaxID=167968 RepID=UPI002610658C|nr:cobalamin biosynthesis protein CbiL [uncultured Desulfovibrio sp.]